MRVLNFRGLTAALLSAMLGLLGFSACRSQKADKHPVDTQEPEIVEPEPQIRLMYGTPNSRFRIIDTVPVDTNATNSTPDNTSLQ